MQKMFEACNSLKTLDISNFDTSCVKDLSVPLPEYLAVPKGARLKTKKTNSFFSKLWEKLSNQRIANEGDADDVDLPEM